MATGSDQLNLSIKVIEEDLSCYICFNLLREPKNLDCQHVYCLNCLQDWVGKDPTINCPECRHVSIVPHGGLANLQTNLRLQNMADKYAANVNKKRSIQMCQNHKAGRQNLSCVASGILSVSQNSLVLDQERPLEKTLKEQKVPAKTRKMLMKTHLNRVKNNIKMVEEDKKTLNYLETKVQAAQKEAQCDVDKRVQVIIAEIEAKGKETKKRIQAISQKHMKTLQQERNRREDSGTRLSNIYATAHDLIDPATERIYIAHHDSLIHQMETMCIALDKMPPFDMACLHFTPGAETTDLGKVAENDHVKRSLILVTEFGQFQQALDIASTRTGLLAVLLFASMKVPVYRDCNGEYKIQFTLGSVEEEPRKKLTKPIGIAVTSGNKFLVLDNASSVKIFSSTGKYESKLAIRGSKITTTKDDMIVIGNAQKGVITVHQFNGELLRIHKVGTEIDQIASNGKQIAFTKFIKGELCAIDFESGQELWRQGLLKCQLGVCYDEMTSSVLCAGNTANRGSVVIEQYCSTTGQLVSRLASGLFNPYSITLTYDGKVAVADFKSVKVYSIQ